MRLCIQFFPVLFFLICQGFTFFKELATAGSFFYIYIDMSPSQKFLKFYLSRAWINLSKAHRKMFPLCQKCLKERGQIVKGRICDHISGICTDGKFDPQKALNPKNLRSLCLSCHNKVTFSSGSDQYISREREKLGKMQSFDY